MIKINIEKIKNVFGWSNLSKVSSSFLAKRARLIMFLLLVALAGYSVYVWYSYVYDFHWAESEKQEYMKNKDKGVSFSKSKFNSIIEEMEGRSKEYDSGVRDLTDIFKLKEKVTEQNNPE